MSRKKRFKFSTFLVVIIAGLIVYEIIVPAYISLNRGREATLTIETYKEPPFTFTLDSDSSSENGPLILQSKIRVRDGKGTFIRGDYENMDYFGSPPFYNTRFSRRIILEIVDHEGALIRREESKLGNVIYLGFEDDPSALNGKRFFVRK